MHREEGHAVTERPANLPVPVVDSGSCERLLPVLVEIEPLALVAVGWSHRCRCAEHAARTADSA